MDGIIGPWFLEPWRRVVREGYEMHYIVLRADKEETMHRAISRMKLDRETPIHLVEVMWGQFCNPGAYERNVIDITHCTAESAASAIAEGIAQKTSLLN